jgi:hypothetical protein
MGGGAVYHDNRVRVDRVSVPPPIPSEECHRRSSGAEASVRPA